MRERTMEVREEGTLASELLERLPSGANLRALSVTDLLSPRTAYWRRFGAPLPAAPERQERMERGRGWHRVLESVLREDGPTEVRVRRGGVSARIDQLADTPVEIKSGGAEILGDLLEERPEWVEQLALYCALVDRTEGRCDYLRSTPDAAPAVRVFDLRFRSASALAARLALRESELRGALEAHTPGSLPRCPWFGRGCEFRTAGICDCRGDEPLAPSPRETVAAVVERDDLAARWTAALRVRESPPAPERWSRFRDLLNPRRTFHDLEEPLPTPARGPAGFGAPDLYERLTGALEGGPAGEVAALAPRGPGPDEEVVGWRGRPYLLKVSRAWNRIRPSELEARFPQYALELGFRCARSGRKDGVVLVGYERAPSDAERVQVLSLSFAEGDPWTTAWQERSVALDRALRARTPLDLPACPSWMVETCPYVAACGCGELLPRSQR